jgi:hypothetical protein
MILRKKIKKIKKPKTCYVEKKKIKRKENF